MAATSSRPHGDRLSALPDATLARVLSHLPTGEAVRSSVLSRRWRSVHTAVPVVSLADSKRGGMGRIYSQPVCFEHQWIVIALKSGAEEVDVAVRYHNSYSRHRLCPSAPLEDGSADFDYQHIGRFVTTPRHIFRSVALRRLRLTNWTLDLPSGDAPAFVSLETLALKKIMAPRGALQRLLSGCQRLTDLTLEQCPTATEITVASAHLRSLTMVCCHKATRVALDTLRLRRLRYRGSLPPDTFFSIANHASIAAVTVDICEDIGEKTPSEVGTIAKLISLCSNLTFLHLSLRPEMASCGYVFTDVLRGLTRLRQLELKGCLLDHHSVASTVALLQSTNNLEALSLFHVPPDPPNKMAYYDDSDSDSDRYLPKDDKDSGDGGNIFVPKSLRRTNVLCLKYKVKKIRVVGYRGHRLERILAKFLLSKAQVLDEISVSMATTGRKDEMAKELASWRCNGRTRVTCV
ncbi:unnamed protein product [Urochloa decumbens]|uniref:F-box domain-containing protein n=1 Tax=Urochloa decumbens TaxID=240449 RepID=A0ABC9D428_9POAL